MTAVLNHDRKVILTPAILIKYPPSPGNDGKVWIGEVVDPAPSDGFLPRTVTMTWGEECDIQVRLVVRDVFVGGRHRRHEKDGSFRCSVCASPTHSLGRDHSHSAPSSSIESPVLKAQSLSPWVCCVSTHFLRGPRTWISMCAFLWHCTSHARLTVGPPG